MLHFLKKKNIKKFPQLLIETEGIFIQALSLNQHLSYFTEHHPHQKQQSQTITKI